jgi:hypothetical protein
MRTLAALLLIGLLAAPALAGDNPNVRAYIDFDPPNYVHCYQPMPYETFNAYFMLDCIPGGIAAVSFLLSDVMAECPGSFAPPTFVNLLPGDIMIGNPFVPPGATIASTMCMYDDPLIVGYVSLFYLGVGDCCIQVMDHWDFPRWVVDCQDPSQVDYYCVLSHGEICQLGCPCGICPPGDPDCDCEPAQPNPDVGLGLHVDYEGYDCSFHLPDCNLINTRLPQVPGQLLDFMVMACYFPNGFTGAEYSLSWPPDWQFINWQSCADFDEDTFDGTNGDGVIQWWEDCQPAPGPGGGPHTLGILTLMVGETRGPVFILPHPDTGVAGVYNCMPTLDIILPDTIGNGRAGYVYIGGQDGCNPCFCVGPPCWPYPAAVEDETWGGIKAMYR